MPWESISKMEFSSCPRLVSSLPRLLQLCGGGMRAGRKTSEHTRLVQRQQRADVASLVRRADLLVSARDHMLHCLRKVRARKGSDTLG